MDELKKYISNNQLEQFKATFKPDDLDRVDNKGNSLLHLAVQKGRLGFVKFLIVNHADVKKTDEKGNSALHLAVKSGYFNIVEEILGLSSAAQKRSNQTNWVDSSKRVDNLDIIKKSEDNAFSLLTVTNINNETPLHLAAKLNDDRIYTTLLALQPGYDRALLDEVLELRKKRLSGVKIKAFFAAILESLCPSASIGELTESFAYAGLVIGASAAVELGLNIAFAVTAIVGLSMITFANYQKIQTEKNARQKLEHSQVEQAFVLNLKKRLQQLQETLIQKGSLTAEQKEELQTIQTALLNNPKPPRIKGDAISAADYITRKEKIYTFISAFGSFLCAYSGLLGVVGLGLGIAALVTGLSMGALVASAGPLGISLALGVGLMFAVLLTAYHLKKLNQDYRVFGEMRMTVSEQLDSIFNEKQDLLNTNALEKIQALLDNNLNYFNPPVEYKNELADSEELFDNKSYSPEFNKIDNSTTNGLNNIRLSDSINILFKENIGSANESDDSYSSTCYNQSPT